jgi:hypothetical protein
MAMNLTKPVFYTAKHLERRFGVNVLGSIRLVRTEAELAVARQNWMLMAGGVGALVVVYVVLMLFAGGPGVGQMAAGGA